MFHEVAHGLGIKNTVNGRGSVRDALRNSGSGDRGSKATCSALYMITGCPSRCELAGALRGLLHDLPRGIFRSVRFGAASAHGQANMLRFQLFADRGALRATQACHYRGGHAKMRRAGGPSCRACCSNCRATATTRRREADAGAGRHPSRAAGRPRPPVEPCHPGGRWCVTQGKGRARSELTSRAMKGVLRVLEDGPRDRGGLRRSPRPAGRRLADRRPVIFFDHMGPATFARRRAAWDGAAAPAHRPRHGDVLVRRRVHAPRQPGTAAVDPPGDVNWMVRGGASCTPSARRGGEAGGGRRADPRHPDLGGVPQEWKRPPVVRAHAARTLPEIRDAGATPCADCRRGVRAARQRPQCTRPRSTSRRRLRLAPRRAADRVRRAAPFYVVRARVVAAGERHGDAGWSLPRRSRALRCSTDAGASDAARWRSARGNPHVGGISSRAWPRAHRARQARTGARSDRPPCPATTSAFPCGR